MPVIRILLETELGDRSSIGRVCFVSLEITPCKGLDTGWIDNRHPVSMLIQELSNHFTVRAGRLQAHTCPLDLHRSKPSLEKLDSFCVIGELLRQYFAIRHKACVQLLLRDIDTENCF